MAWLDLDGEPRCFKPRIHVRHSGCRLHLQPGTLIPSRASSSSSVVHPQSGTTEMSSLTRRALIQAGAVPARPPRFLRALVPTCLFNMLDQWRLDCLGANGNGIIQTPHLDELASHSANFTQACVQAPVCVPSRVSFFTGRYPHSHKNRVNYTPYEQSEPMIQRLLQDAGLRNGLRWEAALPIRRRQRTHAQQDSTRSSWMTGSVERTDIPTT